MLTRRQFGQSALALAISGASVSASAVDRAVSLPDFRRPGDPDDTAALTRAFQSSSSVHAPAGRGMAADGAYLIGNAETATLPAGARLTGDGMARTRIRRSVISRAAFILHCDSGSPDPARNIAGLSFADLSFEDDVVARGFQEFSYLVMLNGVTGVRFERVGFRGFCGDGLHLGSSVRSDVERHNLDVSVLDCRFDGINGNNRNGISVIDCKGLLIERCQFLNITRRGNGQPGPLDPRNPLQGVGMPGAIDLEPNDDAFAVIQDVVIRQNRFVGGGGYAVALNLLPNRFVRTPQRNIVIEDNEVSGRYGGFHGIGVTAPLSEGITPSYAITLRRNRVADCVKPFLLEGLTGVRLDNNIFSDCSEPGEIGHSRGNTNVVLSGNSFDRIGGNVIGYGLWIRNGRGITIENNRFVDCGAPSRRDGIAIALVAGQTTGLRMTGNRFTSPTGRMQQSFTRFRDARLDLPSLAFSGNVESLPGLPLNTAVRQ